MPLTFCKNKAGNIFPAWEKDKFIFLTPTLTNLEEYKKFRRELDELNLENNEEKYAILIDENSGITKIEKMDLPLELQKYMKPFPFKFQ